MSQKEYIRLSLELHLFFDRIMKEHSLFLESAFMPKDDGLKTIANNFQKMFASILENAISMADTNVSNEFLHANEIVTDKTLVAENQTSSASGIRINTDITKREMNLRSGAITVNEQMLNKVSALNRQTIPVIENLIQFKQNILNEVLVCKLYTTNYPLLITHIMNEAKMYLDLLTKVEKKEPFTSKYIYEQEVFWNNIMKEHAEFVRGLLDPSERKLIITADRFAKNYKDIMTNYSNNPSLLTSASLQQTVSFKKFKTAGLEGLIGCKIKSIIVPLLADHILREANHFIRILKSNTTRTKN